MNKIQIMALATTLVILIAGVCTGLYVLDMDDPEIIIKDDLPRDDPSIEIELPKDADFLTLSEAMNDFSFRFYEQLRSGNDENIFFSPYSIFTALAMTYEGANDITAEEMAKILNIPQKNESILKGIKYLYQKLNYGADYNISTANALWVKESLKLLDEFSELISEYYGGKASNIDFSDPANAAEIINDWVEENTKGKIKDLVKPEHINPIYTVLVLTNAIYFKDQWRIQFNVDDTIDRDFTLESGETIKTPTMRFLGKEDLFNYTETEDMQILELPYKNDDISMMIFLPKDKKLEEVLESVNESSLSKWKNRMTKCEVDIYLPKFKLETSYELSNVLKEMGMVNPFTPSAKFEGFYNMTELAEVYGVHESEIFIYISKVLHKAFIEVNEEGTEAAAATAVIMCGTTSVDPTIPQRIVFDADHPFMFMIQQKETGNILFMGSMTDPSS